MSILTFLVIGLLAGFLASKLVEGHGFGVFGDIVIGVIGAYVGGMLSINSSYFKDSFVSAVFVSTVGAVVFLLIAGVLNTLFRVRRLH